MGKTIVTHTNPHLDDIAAIWLFKKFHPDFTGAEIKFVSQSKTDELAGEENDDTVFMGIGKGRFDEHKGDLGKSAMGLVWEEIVAKGLAPTDEFEVKAFEEIVKWNTLYDMGQMPLGDYDDFSVESFIRSGKNSEEDSLKTVELGAQILDRILPNVIRTEQALKDFNEKKIVFDTKWGKGMGISSDTFGKTMGYRNGFAIVVQKSPKNNNVGITTPGTSDNDISGVYDKLKEVDSSSDWFLHHSHKMVLCGTGSAPDAKRTNLSLEELIEIVKSVK